MPTIVYTPDEQKKLDALNALVTSSKAKLDSLNQGVTAEYNQMNNVFNSGVFYSGNYNNLQPSLTAQLGFGTMNANNCKGNGQVKKPCINAVGQFNYYYGRWIDYQSQAKVALDAYNTAVKNLNDYQTTLNNSPDIKSQQQTNVLNAGINKTKWWIFGIIVVVILVVVVIILRRKTV